ACGKSRSGHSAGRQVTSVLFFSCKKRTKRTLIKNLPQGISLREIFVWNFFGSFFAKKEQTRPARLTGRTAGGTMRKTRQEVPTMYQAASQRYDTMPYRRSGRSGLRLPAVSLGLWHNFGDTTPYETM